jgi:hypothetical protein
VIPATLLSPVNCRDSSAFFNSFNCLSANWLTNADRGILRLVHEPGQSRFGKAARPTSWQNSRAVVPGRDPTDTATRLLPLPTVALRLATGKAHERLGLCGSGAGLISGC